MSRKNSIRNIDEWNKVTGGIDVIPDTCPICGKSIEPIPVLDYIHDGKRFDISERKILCICPNNNCNELFISRYEKHKFAANEQKYAYRGSYPYIPKEIEFEELMKKISPKFIEIFNQSNISEKYGLDQIAGIGYRKALEFLIKDYSIHLHSSEQVKIKKLTLSNCITDYIKNTNIKEVSKRAVWLGNDESHYERRWEEKDIKDLKLLINLVVKWISMEVNTNKYIAEMK